MKLKRAGANAGRDRPIRHADSVAAYCDGLGLAAIVLVADQAGSRLAALSPAIAVQSQQAEPVRWWCRRMGDAECVAAAATRAIARRTSNDCADRIPTTIQGVAAAVEAAAKRNNVALYADKDIFADAKAVTARVDAEFARFRDTGELRAINQSYRRLRLEASARGEKMPPYAQWLNKYRINLVRELAAALR